MKIQFHNLHCDEIISSIWYIHLFIKWRSFFSLIHVQILWLPLTMIRGAKIKLFFKLLQKIKKSCLRSLYQIPHQLSLAQIESHAHSLLTSRGDASPRAGIGPACPDIGQLKGRGQKLKLVSSIRKKDREWMINRQLKIHIMVKIWIYVKYTSLCLFIV